MLSVWEEDDDPIAFWLQVSSLALSAAFASISVVWTFAPTSFGCGGSFISRLCSMRCYWILFAVHFSAILNFRTLGSVKSGLIVLWGSLCSLHVWTRYAVWEEIHLCACKWKKMHDSLLRSPNWSWIDSSQKPALSKTLSSSPLTAKC